MPTGDVTPPGCPRAKLHSKASETLAGRPIVTARAAEITCRSLASSTQTASADKKLKQKPVVDLSRMGEEELRSISSKGSSQRPRTSTPVEGARPQLAETEPMEVDPSEVPSTSHSSGAGAAVCPKTKGANASQAQSTGQHQRVGPKTKQRATDQQGVHAMVANVMDHHGVNQEDWEQSQGPDYRMDPLRPPTWVIHPAPGQHLATLEGVSVDEWQAELDITLDELLRWLTMVARGTSQACSYRSQESYFQTIQVVKETIQRYEDAQGLQYHEKPVHLDCTIMGRFWQPMYTTKGSYAWPRMRGKRHETERSTPKSNAGKLRMK